MRHLSSMLLATVLITPLTGCDWVMNVSGLNSEAHKAIGASCRQTGRSLEECFQRNPQADRAQVFAGWKEMNEYMTKNKLDTLTPPPDLPSPEELEKKRKEEEEAKKKAASLGPDGKPDPEVEAVLRSLGDKHSDARDVADNGGEKDLHKVMDIINDASPPPANPIPGINS